MVVDRYFSALSGNITTMLPLSIRRAVATAANIAAPELMPANMPSCEII